MPLINGTCEAEPATWGTVLRDCARSFVEQLIMSWLLSHDDVVLKYDVVQRSGLSANGARSRPLSYDVAQHSYSPWRWA